jgi:hypothetical protein
MLFAKTLVRKNVASTAASDSTKKDEKDGKNGKANGKNTTNGTPTDGASEVTAIATQDASTIVNTATTSTNAQGEQANGNVNSNYNRLPTSYQK